MGTAFEPADLAHEAPRHAGGASTLALHPFLSLLFCLAMGQLVVFWRPPAKTG